MFRGRVADLSGVNRVVNAKDVRDVRRLYLSGTWRDTFWINRMTKRYPHRQRTGYMVPGRTML